MNTDAINKAAKKYAIDRGKEGFIRLNTVSDIEQREYSFKAGALWYAEQLVEQEEEQFKKLRKEVDELIKREGGNT